MEACTTTPTTHITFELPLSDAMRICLRLEQLAQQFDRGMTQIHTQQGTKNTMNAVLKTLEVTDRPDLKSKLGQMLTQYTSTFQQLTQSPKVDHDRLKNTLDKLERLNHYLHTNQQRIGESLRQNEFLYQIRSNLSNPGGVCDHRTPAYLLWQNQPSEQKAHDLNQWMETFASLRNIVITLLQLTRDSTPSQIMTAENGFYHQTLSVESSCHLIRVKLPTDYQLYPEFSAGKHRLTIRFLSPNYMGDGRPQQTQHNISFQLSCCKL